MERGTHLSNIPRGALVGLRTNIYCKGGVDTPHTGVDTMFQALRQKMKKWSSSVDTRPGQLSSSGRLEDGKKVTSIISRTEENATVEGDVTRRRVLPGQRVISVVATVQRFKLHANLIPMRGDQTF
ncbi:hypothetical protein Taro_054888 [Colocasia esculenta]|uniref:Uncharacterized protein n=1 Tax=Colocasia esculenta TaxID=4460 RepID=A0A843XRQ2_COLES|nr:hypothetical protein [Colocasia esculenta]